MPSRRFEFKEGNSAKFWEVAVKGKTQTVTFGRIGAKGQTKTREFDSRQQAVTFGERLILEKTSKGYREVSTPTSNPRKKTTKGTRTSPKSKAAELKSRTKSSLGTDSVADAWKRLEAWFAKHMPSTLDMLYPPVKPQVIRAVEKAIGQELPEPVRESYRIHNGQANRVNGMLFGLPLLPLGQPPKGKDDCFGHWKNWSDYERSKQEHNFDHLASCFPAETVQPVYFDRGWLPFSHDGGGNHLAIDLNPGPNGTRGQVIVCGRDDTFHPVLAVNFAQFLSDVATELERGNFIIEKPEVEPIFYMAKPTQEHFHVAGANWSRAKLGLRKLSKDDEKVWNQRRLKK